VRGYIVKRGPRSFAAVVYLGRDPQTGKERRKWYSFKTRREAEGALAHLVGRVISGGTIPSTKIRVGEFLEGWLRDYVAAAVAPTTQASYRDTVRVHLAPALGHIPLSRLTPQAVQGYICDKLRRGLSTTTVRYHIAILHRSLAHAIKWGLLAHNSVDRVDLPRKARREIHVWDWEQIRLFLAEAKRSSSYYCLYLAAITTGMRQGELLGLRWKDVDLLAGVASIQQTLYRLGKRLLVKEPKSNRSRRTVALAPILVEELRRMQQEQVARHQELGNAYQDHGLVFCQPIGKPPHAHNIVRRDFREVMKNAGVPRIRFHDLRHCHATLLLQQGVHPKVVQERLGHSSVSMTLDTYSHVVPGLQERAVTELETRLFGQSRGATE
jgi:integrase